MKKKVTMLLVVLLLFNIFTSFDNAFASNNLYSEKELVQVDLYLDNSGRIFSYFENSKPKILKDASNLGKTTTILGVQKGLINKSASYNLVNGIKTIKQLDGKEDTQMLYKSTIRFIKAQLFTSVKKLPKSIQDHILSYDSLWARPLIDATLEYVDTTFVGHRTEKYDAKVHLLIAKYYFGKETHDWLGVYYNIKTKELVLCKDVGTNTTTKVTKAPTKTPKETVTPTATKKPKITPTPVRATATPKVTAEPTKKPPKATPRVTPEPERPGSNSVGGYGSNPLTNVTVAPVATPKVTPEPNRPSDNQDGGKKDSQTSNVNTFTAKPVATPKVAKPQATPESFSFTPKPSAKPVVTPSITTETITSSPTPRPKDNNDGGYGENPLS